MPSNVFVRYEDELSKELCEVAKIKIKSFSEEILIEKEKLQINSLILKFITRLFSTMESAGARFFGKNLNVSENCNEYLICTKICPTSNIYFSDGRIKFGWKCIFCMRCIYNCPNKSISPRFLNFFVLQEGYSIDKIIQNTKTKGRYLFEDKNGFTKDFIDM